MATDPSNSQRVRRRRTTSSSNPLQAGVASFLQCKPDQKIAIPSLPKRYTLYPPLLLLPPNFTSSPAEWRDLYSSLTPDEKHDLFTRIAKAFRGQSITHIAINAPIAPETSDEHVENVMRSPSNLTPVYGDFGPDSLVKSDSNGQPTRASFDTAFWVSTSQHQSIVQCWAPRWTMFSRGNISEKARILQAGGTNPFPGLTEAELEQDLREVEIVDFYAGIGYFASCYLARGVKRVYGWDINGWSIEGLRRGCEANGWRCAVVRVSEEGELIGQSVEELASVIINGATKNNPVRCLAFLGDNKWTTKVHGELRKAMQVRGCLDTSKFRHANLGLLPTSRGSWVDAVHALDVKKGGWLHVHENTDMRRLDEKKDTIVQELQRIVIADRGDLWTVCCKHIEGVKTYAPGVMHCVFDIAILPSG